MSGGGSSDGGITRNRDGVPQWGGDPATFHIYEEEAYLWEQTVAWHKRHACAPKLKAELQGTAKRLILGQPADWAALLSFLRARLGKPQLPELSDLLVKYFRGTKRRAQESINDYITRKCEVYVRAQQSLLRVQGSRPGAARSTESTEPGRRSAWENGDYWSWPPSSRRSSVASHEEDEEETEERAG